MSKKMQKLIDPIQPFESLFFMPQVFDGRISFPFDAFFHFKRPF